MGAIVNNSIFLLFRGNIIGSTSSFPFQDVLNKHVMLCLVLSCAKVKRLARFRKIGTRVNTLSPRKYVVMKIELQHHISV